MPTREERAYARAVGEAAAFTAENPIGTPVRYWPGVRDEAQARVSTIRSAAWALLSGQAIVKVAGYPGGIALSHVEPLPKTDESEGQEP